MLYCRSHHRRTDPESIEARGVPTVSVTVARDSRRQSKFRVHCFFPGRWVITLACPFVAIYSAA